MAEDPKIAEEVGEQTAKRFDKISDMLMTKYGRALWAQLPSPKGAIAAVFIALLVPFVTFGESQIKSVLSVWLDKCLIVLESKDLPQRQERLVTVYVAGSPPKAIPLSFNAFKANTILAVQLTGHEEAQIDGAGGQLGLHPLANQTCPGDLCPGIVETPSGERSRDILLTDIDTSFTLQFRVYFSQPISDGDFATFVAYRPSLKDGVCRVEASSLTNLPLRLSALWRVIFFAGLLLVAGYAVALLRK